MVRRSWLDGVIESFQHRWETNPQYRATMSGVLGIVFLVFMCGCVGIVSAGANVALNSLGFGGGNNSNAAPGDQNTGSKVVRGAVQIPIATVTLGTPQAIPQTTLPASGTPLPTPTPSPTATATATPVPCTSNCGGGGGGKGCPDCSVSGNGTPTPWKVNQSATVYVHTSKPNTPVNIIVDIGSGCTFLNQGVLDPNQPATDGAGNGSWSFTVGCAYRSSATVQLQAAFSSGVVSSSFSQPVG